jgi:hypothetical protein
LFLDNVDQRTVYALQEFHGLFQGDLSVHDYFSRLKQLADLLRDVGHPVSDPAMVTNALRGLNSKFSHAISVLTTRKPLPTFLFTRDYLLQEEAHQKHTAKMEVASALVAGTTSVLSIQEQWQEQQQKAQGQRQQEDHVSFNRHECCDATMVGVVQPLDRLGSGLATPDLAPIRVGLLGPRPGNMSQLMLTATLFPPSIVSTQ